MRTAGVKTLFSGVASRYAGTATPSSTNNSVSTKKKRRNSKRGENENSKMTPLRLLRKKHYYSKDNSMTTISPKSTPITTARLALSSKKTRATPGSIRSMNSTSIFVPKVITSEAGVASINSSFVDSVTASSAVMSQRQLTFSSIDESTKKEEKIEKQQQQDVSMDDLSEINSISTLSSRAELKMSPDNKRSRMNGEENRERQDISMDDLSEINSVSTLSSRVELKISPPEKKSINVKRKLSSRSLASGKLFLYVEQEAKTANGVGLGKTGTPTTTAQSSPIPAVTEISEESRSVANETKTIATNSNKEKEKIPGELTITHNPSISEEMEIYEEEKESSLYNEEYIRDDQDLNYDSGGVRDLIARNIKNNEVDYFAAGKAAYEFGEQFVALGKYEEAKHAFTKAQEFQKESISQLSSKLGNIVHTQGLNHCDNGDTRLAIILLGVAEMLKHRPNNAEHIQLATDNLIGYRRICPLDNPTFELPRRAMDKTVRELGIQAKPMAKTMQAYANTLRLLNKRQ